MDWLSQKQAKIDCRQGIILFVTLKEENVEITRKSGRNPLRVVKANKLVKGFQKGLPIYILKINKPDKKSEGEEPEWL